MMRRILTWIARGSAIGLAGCLVGACVAEETGADSSDEAIYGGTPDDTGTDAVVFIQTRTSETTLGLCTGALVAPNLVLTARHCISRDLTDGVSCNQNGQSLNGEHFSTDYTAQDVSIQIGARQKREVARGKEIIHPVTPYICDADVAFVVLDRPVPGITPLKVRYKSKVVANETIASIGYGRNNTGAAATTRLKRAGVRVLAAGPSTSNLGTAVANREFEVTQSICSGDSGGPAISERTGAVVGVVSRGGDCQNDFGQIYTMTFGFPDTFGRAMASAGVQLVDESDAADGGTTDAGSSEAGRDGAAAPSDAGVDAQTPSDGGGSDAGTTRADGGDAGSETPQLPEDEDAGSKKVPKKKKAPKQEAGEEDELPAKEAKKAGCIPSSVASDRAPASAGLWVLGLALLVARRRAKR